VADVETTLVWSAIQNGDLPDVLARGVYAEHFADEDVAEVYDWASDFYAQHKQPPTSEAMSIEFPRFKARLSKEPTKYHLKRFIRQCNERKAEECLRDFFDQMEDPDALDDIDVHAIDFANQLAEVIPAPRAEYFGKGAIARKERYDKRKRDGEKPGMMLGIPRYDAIMQGLQDHELLVYAGPPGSGKTTGMQHTSMNGYLQGRSGLFVSLEVEAEQILRKFDVMMSNVSYLAMKALAMEAGDERKWTEILERAEFESPERDIIIRDDIKNCTVEKVTAETIRHKPGFVVVDYLEEMRSRKGLSDWESVRENARGLKQSARVSRIPHITGTQINRDGDTAHQSIHKIADAIIQLYPDDDDEKIMTYRLLKYRDGPSRAEVTMQWDLDRMIIEQTGHRMTYKPLGTKPSTNGHRSNGKPSLAGLGKTRKSNPWSRPLVSKS
jgi:KaiC/GvpD/RAD55 family RecA-like ATPase